MKIVIVIDKFCLVGFFVLSTYVSYKVGFSHGEIKQIRRVVAKSNNEFDDE